jgi:hydroxymethylpyrimidine/phosphomethylpyrimidine kinase
LPAHNSKIPIALTIAGSDPGGGAGIQADLKTFAALGVHGYSVLTQVIAQNSSRITDVEHVSPQLVVHQMETLADEAMPAAVKTGALANRFVVKAVAAALEDLKMPRIVLDPVIVASSGARLLGPKGEAAIRKRLIPLARVVTPNIPEAEGLTDMKLDSDSAIRDAAKKIVKLGADGVVIKGGHGKDQNSAIDWFYDGNSFVELRAARIKGGGAHGTGCAFASAIAAYLARGMELDEAVRGAKRYITAALKNSFKLGKGRPLLDHFRAAEK